MIENWRYFYYIIYNLRQLEDEGLGKYHTEKGDRVLIKNPDVTEDQLAFHLVTLAEYKDSLGKHDSFMSESRCNRLRCPLARMSGLQCFNMGHNGHGINLYGVSMTLMGN